MTQEQFMEVRALRRKVAGVLREVDDLLRDHQAAQRDEPRLVDIQDAAGSLYNFTRRELQSPRRQPALVRARHIAIYLCKELTSRSYPEIARAFGNRAHSAAIYGHQKITSEYLDDKNLVADIAALTKKLSGNPCQTCSNS